MTTRAKAVRVVASSLCFDQDPPPVRSLTNARIAAAGIIDALADAGMITIDDAADTNGATVGNDSDAADDDATPLFPVQAAAGA